MMIETAAHATAANGAVGADTLKQQVLVNHFTNATGCSIDQATQLLQASRWEFETALSVFFQEAGVPNQRHPGINPQMCPPCNTPATPPSFPDALLALQKLGASDGASWGAAPMSPPPPPSQQTMGNPFNLQTKVLTSCNHHGIAPFSRGAPADNRYSTTAQNCDWPMLTDVDEMADMDGDGVNGTGDIRVQQVSLPKDIRYHHDERHHSGIPHDMMMTENMFDLQPRY